MPFVKKKQEHNEYDLHVTWMQEKGIEFPPESRRSQAIDCFVHQMFKPEQELGACMTLEVTKEHKVLILGVLDKDTNGIHIIACSDGESDACKQIMDEWDDRPLYNLDLEVQQMMANEKVQQMLKEGGHA